jgi:hypothetical protein
MSRMRTVTGVGAARTVWWVIATVGAAMYVAALPAAYDALRSLRHVELVETSALRDALDQTGWDTGTFAALCLGLLVAYTAAAVGASVVVFRRAGSQPGALLVATVLLCHGWGWPPVMDSLGGRWPAYDAVGSLVAWAGIAGLLALPFVFPDGRFVPPWTRWVALLMAADLVLSSVGASPISLLPSEVEGPARAVVVLSEIVVM